MPAPAASDLRPVRVWDLPTRLFHWALALTVLGSFVSGEIGGNAMEWHLRFGVTALGLLAFRILWGLVGGRWSRFASFVYAPGTLLRYLRGRARADEHLDVGHSPTGALSVFALLGLLALQVGTGLFADDEIATVGPLNRFVSNAVAHAATEWHEDWGSKLILGLVLLHVAMVLYYLLRKKIDLLRPMIGGDKLLPAEVPASRDGAGMRMLALVLALACAALAVWVVRLGG